jgi:hypothetical protein
MPGALIPRGLSFPQHPQPEKLQGHCLQSGAFTVAQADFEGQSNYFLPGALGLSLGGPTSCPQPLSPLLPQWGGAPCTTPYPNTTLQNVCEW